MRPSKFYQFGTFIYHFRWPIVFIWLLCFVACIPFLPHITSPFKITGFIDENSSSAKAEEYLDKQLGFNNKNKIIIMYYSSTLLATDPLFLKKMKDSLADLKNFPVKHIIIYPQDKKQISKDKHRAYAVVIIKSDKLLSNSLLDEFKNSIKTPSKMSIKAGGESFFIESVDNQTKEDLYKADFIATPVALITMILVFGSLVAAVLPIILGGGCALIILTILYFFGHLFSLSIFTINIALLLGLCLSLDYALFFISRFRDELEKKVSIEEAISLTQAHAGKAIFFSALAVFASLSALFLFPVNILFSVAVGGLVAVFVSMMVAIILLPAILSILKHKINSIALRSFKKDKKKGFRPWYWIADKVVHRPLVFFIAVLSFLLLLGYPFVDATFGIADYKIFPKDSKNRQFYNTYAQQFDINELTPISLVVSSEGSPILAKKNLYKLYDLAQDLKKNKKIKKINSIVTTSSSLTKDQYYTLYHNSSSLKQKDIKNLLESTTHKNTTVMTLVSKYPAGTELNNQLIQDLKHLKKISGLKIELTGQTIINKEVLEAVYHYLPYAVAWIMIFTYLILLILLRSLFLPFKAILMNLLSLSACFGALVLVFQEGYLAQILNFQPQEFLDISLLVIIFCALFGFSMDYEVFLLSRIKEFYEVSKDNTQSIMFGIEKSSRIITSAALIVIVLCGSFWVAEVLMVKAFGLGIAVAIFVDAFLIRTILVPATMTLLTKWNWYLPKWLDKILPKC